MKQRNVFILCLLLFMTSVLHGQGEVSAESYRLGNITFDKFGSSGVQFRLGSKALLLLSSSYAAVEADVFRTYGSFEIFHGLSANGTQGLRILNATPGGNANEWRLYAQDNGGDLRFYFNQVSKGYISSVNGTYNSLSDRRLKRSIKDLDPLLPKVLKLSPKTYVFRDAPAADPSIGFIAQEVEALFPALVSSNSDSEEADPLLGLNYGGFGVLAIKAIQEQQVIIDQLEQRLSDLEALIKKD